MRLLVVGFVVSNLLASTSFAREENVERTVKAGAGVATAVGSGIYAAKKFVEASKIKSVGTENLYSHSLSNSPVSQSKVQKALQNLTNGDRITIRYNLSLNENREYHINRMEELASSERSSATSHGIQAATATRQVTHGTGPNAITVTEPDISARALHAQLAVQAMLDAAEYDRKADDARRGGAVPIYEHEKVIDAKRGTSVNTSEFIAREMDRGGKILSVDRLPVEKVNLARSAMRRGAGGVVGVAVGVGYAAKVLVEADTVRDANKNWYPDPSSYRDERTGAVINARESGLR
ncbi:hypothetical protein D3C87_1381450 [compost metagenome]